MMLLLVAVSFVITGIVSSLHFKNANKIYHKDRLLRKEKAIEAHRSSWKLMEGCGLCLEAMTAEAWAERGVKAWARPEKMPLFQEH